MLVLVDLCVQRGVMELVDLVVVNKCDGELVVPARRAAVAYSSALRLLRSVGMLSDADDGHPGHGTDAGDRVPKWAPRVLKTSALKGDGVRALYLCYVM